MLQLIFPSYLSRRLRGVEGQVGHVEGQVGHHEEGQVGHHVEGQVGHHVIVLHLCIASDKRISNRIFVIQRDSEGL